MTLHRVVCGFQSGVDQAGARAARSAGLATGGWMPQGWLTEDGPRPEFAALYGARELPGAGYPERTRANARDSDGTTWLGPVGSAGFRATERACHELGQPLLVVPFGPGAGDRLIGWLEAEEIGTLNVAGSRESKCPGIGARAERFLAAVFRRLTSA